MPGPLIETSAAGQPAVAIHKCQKRGAMAMNGDRAHHLTRIRTICASLPELTERLSHGEPTFFVGKRACLMFADHHHGDPRIAIWLPVPPGAQQALIEGEPAVFFRPPYVWMHGWVGIDLDAIGDDELRAHIEVAWGLVAPRRLTGVG